MPQIYVYIPCRLANREYSKIYQFGFRFCECQPRHLVYGLKGKKSKKTVAVELLVVTKRHQPVFYIPRFT